MGRKVVYVTPIEVKGSGLRRAVIGSIHSFSLKNKGGNKNTKVVNPNVDVLPALRDVAGVGVKKGDYSYELFQDALPGKVVSLYGILRALLILKMLSPKLYYAFITTAKLLSYEVNDEIHVPCLTFMLEGQNSQVSFAWSQVEKIWKFPRKLYAKFVIDEMKRSKLSDVFSLMGSTKMADESLLEEFNEDISSEIPDWYLKNRERMQDWEDIYKLEYFGPDVEYTREELEAFVEEFLKSIT